jgi:hypothetical protein
MEHWPILAALLAILGGFAVARYNAYRTASAKFRTSILSSLSGLYPHPVNWPMDSSAIDSALKSVFPALQVAVAEFSAALPFWRRPAFDRAWLRYCCSTGRKCDKNTYHHYMGFHAPGEPIPDVQAIFHENVTRLLRFANET